MKINMQTAAEDMEDPMQYWRCSHSPDAEQDAGFYQRVAH